MANERLTDEIGLLAVARRHSWCSPNIYHRWSAFVVRCGKALERTPYTAVDSVLGQISGDGQSNSSAG